MNKEEKEAIVDSLTVAVEVMGYEMSEAALQMMVVTLSGYNYQAVQNAIMRMVKECKFKPTPHEVISRIDDGRPSADEAWQQVSHLSEEDSRMMTVEQRDAYCTVSTMMDGADTTAKISAKKAFIDTYKRMCQDSRDSGRPVSYVMSWGRDDGGRVAAVTEAIALGKLTKQKAVAMLPHFKETILGLPAPEQDAEGVRRIGAMVKQIGVRSEED